MKIYRALKSVAIHLLPFAVMLALLTLAKLLHLPTP